MSKRFLVLFFKKELFFLLLCSAAHAAPPISITDAWARASLPHQTDTAAYMTLTSRRGDTLTGVESSDAGMVMLHQTTTKGGMSDMSDMDSVALPAGKNVAFAPGGMHLMVMDVKHPLVAGDTLHLVLHFTHAGNVAENVPVLPANATGPLP
jgi:copper(I)-binding protein